MTAGDDGSNLAWVTRTVNHTPLRAYVFTHTVTRAPRSYIAGPRTGGAGMRSVLLLAEGYDRGNQCRVTR
jgi:hypothetical protein